MAGFVCIYYGNTGSSWLLDALAASPQVLVPGFEPVEGWAWDAPHDERVEWVRTALDAPPERQGARYDTWVEALRASPQVDVVPNKPGFERVGFKMNDLAVFATEATVDALADSGAKAIVLTRENRIKHALSLYRYHEEGKSQFGENKGERPPSKVGVRAFDRWVKESQRLHGEALRVRAALVDRLGPEKVTDLAYEEFSSEEGKQGTIDRLAAFLGIEPIELTEGRFKKATSDDLRSAIVNYDTLRLRYALSPLRSYFRD